MLDIQISLPQLDKTSSHQNDDSNEFIHSLQLNNSQPDGNSDLGNISPHFINITETVSLDKSARQQVRVQVMRDYHRRRMQDESKEKNVLLSARREGKPLSVKSQTLKFRLGQGSKNVLRPWMPVKKTPLAKRAGASQKIVLVREKMPPMSKAQSVEQPALTMNCVPWPNDDGEAHTELTFSRDTIDDREDILSEELQENWFSALDLTIKSSALYNSPGSETMDPFSSTSLVITPRRQLLLHHYCKSFPTIFHMKWLFNHAQALTTLS